MDKTRRPQRVLKKICVFTSTRADYGLLRHLLRELQDSKLINLKLLISGTHLAFEYGMTLNEIQNDGFCTDCKVDIEIRDDSATGICSSMGSALEQYGNVLDQMKPDILIILGDRFESFCCAAAAHICNIPIAHIHGGETTQGAVDEAFRHSITKMAQIHFPCCETYRQRIIQMGEHPDSVFNVGALGVENLKHMKFMDRNELENHMGMRLDTPYFLITFHPETLELQNTEEQFAELLQALEKFSGHKFIFTGTNADAHGGAIETMQHQFSFKYPDRCYVTPSLGYKRYLSAMAGCDVVVGNSSSGIFEAPVLGVPTVNIGGRQAGRIKPKSVVDCAAKAEMIFNSLTQVQVPEFKYGLKDMEIPFDKPGTAKKIKTILEDTILIHRLKKSFFDIPFQSNHNMVGEQ